MRPGSVYPNGAERRPMHPELRSFLAGLAGVALMTLSPIAFITFVSVPLNLQPRLGDLTQHDPARPCPSR